MPRTLTLLALLAAPALAAAAEKPNILLILSDDPSVPHLGCYANPDIKTPNCDAFASEGMRFDRYYVGTPQCVPSRATIMTGRSAIAVQRLEHPAPGHLGAVVGATGLLVVRHPRDRGPPHRRPRDAVRLRRSGERVKPGRRAGR